MGLDLKENVKIREETNLLYLGTTGWKYEHWFNGFYPTNNSDDWLKFYAERSAFSEIRYTFNKLPADELVQTWANETPNYFIFAASMTKTTTFIPSHEVQDEEIVEFFDRLKPLKNKLTMVILQFPKNFQNTPQTITFLESLLQSCKSKFSGNLLLDVQNRSWNKEDVNAMLIKNHASILSTDRRPIVSQMSNPDIYYLRLQGDTGLIPTKDFGKVHFPRKNDLKHWATHLKFRYKRHKKIFVAIDNHFSGNSTTDGYQLSEQLMTQQVKKFYGFRYY
ncbi:MAG: DUF72 domain-containing protein [Candidatus Heimdallarchaeota archaeon]|nr:DUF72 domain-containing protein [Candidatus Heimdallarchaeota archaeon]